MRAARTARSTMTTIVAGLALAEPSAAAVPYKTIASSGPLVSVSVGNEGSCQIGYRGDARLELYPSSTTPGDCGTLVAVGPTLYAPAFAQHGSTATSSLGATTAFTAVSQTDVSGAGSAASPYTVTTVYDVGATGLRVTEVDTYVTGQEYYRTDVTLRNGGASAQAGVLYRAGDCYLQESDTGFGFVEAANRGPGCARNANNAPAGRIEQWVPLTAGSSYMEDRFSAVWAAIASRQPLPNTCKCTEALDNGAGLSWSFSVAPGTTSTYSHLTVFSPTGVTGGQQTQPATPPAPAPPAPAPPAAAPPTISSAEVPRVLPLPSNRRCTSRRAFPIRVRQYRRLRFSFAIVAVNGRRVPVYVYTTRRLRLTRIGAAYLNRRRFRAFVDLRGVAKGRYAVRVTAVTADGQVLSFTRRYRTCTRRLAGSIPRL